MITNSGRLDQHLLPEPDLFISFLIRIQSIHSIPGFKRKHFHDFKYFEIYFKYGTKLKGIVSRDFGGLQMNLFNRFCVPDVPLEAYSFLNFHLHIVF